ncbi:hypothetical protein [Pseudodesulfovibrio sp.]|uniref:hypothetical protein n=1 Tax=unclassified Pseudodesulfovibrio TaxID=2661612 RepID=UPI003AFFA95E
MSTYILAGIGLVAIAACAVLILTRRRPKRNRLPLDTFNFDKQKKYEKDGRKFPFSY